MVCFKLCTCFTVVFRLDLSSTSFLLVTTSWISLQSCNSGSSTMLLYIQPKDPVSSCFSFTNPRPANTKWKSTSLIVFFSFLALPVFTHRVQSVQEKQLACIESRTTTVDTSPTISENICQHQPTHPKSVLKEDQEGQHQNTPKRVCQNHPKSVTEA